jgi:hypothetical protein
MPINLRDPAEATPAAQCHHPALLDQGTQVVAQHQADVTGPFSWTLLSQSYITMLDRTF